MSPRVRALGECDGTLAQVNWCQARARGYQIQNYTQILLNQMKKGCQIAIVGWCYNTSMLCNFIKVFNKINEVNPKTTDNFIIRWYHQMNTIPNSGKVGDSFWVAWHKEPRVQHWNVLTQAWSDIRCDDRKGAVLSIERPQTQLSRYWGGGGKYKKPFR